MIICFLHCCLQATAGGPNINCKFEFRSYLTTFVVLPMYLSLQQGLLWRFDIQEYDKIRKYRLLINLVFSKVLRFYNKTALTMIIITITLVIAALDLNTLTKWDMFVREKSQIHIHTHTVLILHQTLPYTQESLQPWLCGGWKGMCLQSQLSRI